MKLLHLSLLTLGITSVHSLTITDDPASILNHTFNYIVVGGGSAGLTIANRLTEDKQTTVLVIEAGDDLRNDPRTTDPGLYTVADYTNISWGYVTTNQSIGGKQQVINAGKVLGGSSAINGMQWSRDTIGQYDVLEELGNEGWNFKTMQQYMKKAEHSHTPNANQTSLGVGFNATAHGKSGNINSGFPNPYPCPSCNLWDTLVNSTAQTYPGLRADNKVDQCDGDPRGVARCMYSITPGSSDGVTQNIRSSSAHGFIFSLAPGDRPNLYILTGHLATKIVWKTTQPPSPKGVAFEVVTNTSSSQSFVVQVAKEVIVSSGALGSPKFLELSGIGDRKILEKFDIPVVADLPSVGTNLQDQAGINNAFIGTDLLNGPPGHTSVAGMAAFVTLPQILGLDAAAEYVQLMQSTIKARAGSIVSSGAAVSVKGMEKMLSIQARQYGLEDAPVVEISYILIPGSTILVGSSSWVLIPQYRGMVHIASSDPRVPPAVNPNYLTDTQDFSLLVNMSMVLHRIWSPATVKQFASTEVLPSANVQSDEDFVNFVTDNYITIIHPIGSLAMLPKDMGGAVDSMLRVYGVRGVRVADASVLPIQSSAHPLSTVYGIAEKAADLIRTVHRHRTIRLYGTRIYGPITIPSRLQTILDMVRLRYGFDRKETV
ncbi:hypothetical protein BDQ17DRAFT_1376345 [Cyathus striatus]|nr:hypothetical protein BDQ17DRAFT_1376345 [Cyathus striatus]